MKLATVWFYSCVHFKYPFDSTGPLHCVYLCVWKMLRWMHNYLYPIVLFLSWTPNFRLIAYSIFWWKIDVFNCLLWFCSAVCLLLLVYCVVTDFTKTAVSRNDIPDISVNWTVYSKHILVKKGVRNAKM